MQELYGVADREADPAADGVEVDADELNNIDQDYGD